MGDYFLVFLQGLSQVDLFQIAIVSVSVFGVVCLVIKAIRG